MSASRQSPDDHAVAAPTTQLIDGRGVVRWVFRAGRVFDRLTPAQLLAAIDGEMPAG